ncbi:MAG: hypothetical protein GVY11_06345 [Gammaproteobacteria bacterium]|nr:hypothetical protein [Gammaproteobacteria bacterium]
MLDADRRGHDDADRLGIALRLLVGILERRRVRQRRILGGGAGVEPRERGYDELLPRG